MKIIILIQREDLILGQRGTGHSNNGQDGGGLCNSDGSDS